MISLIAPLLVQDNMLWIVSQLVIHNCPLLPLLPIPLRILLSPLHHLFHLQDVHLYRQIQMLMRRRRKVYVGNGSSLLLLLLLLLVLVLLFLRPSSPPPQIPTIMTTNASLNRVKIHLGPLSLISPQTILVYIHNVQPAQ